MDKTHKDLRKRMMQWHRNKQKSIKIIDLLGSNYQCFRSRVCRRLDVDLDFYEAIKQANYDELTYLNNYILEEKLGI